MKRVLLATHGKFADGIYNSLEIIMGKQQNIDTLCAYVDEENDIELQVKNIMEKLDSKDELIVITDLFGGSVNNAFMNYLYYSNLHLITGLNLPLLLELVSNLEQPTKKMIEEVVSSSKINIQYCNPLINEEQIEEDF